LGTIEDQGAAGATGASGTAGAAGAVRASGSAAATPGAKTNGAGVAATPSARRAARENKVDLGSVQSEGPRVTTADIARSASAVSKPAARSPQPVGRSEERVRMSKRRATIAKRLVEAQQTAAMLTTFNEVDMGAVMALRERQKQAFKDKYGIGLGIASFF